MLGIASLTLTGVVLGICALFFSAGVGHDSSWLGRTLPDAAAAAAQSDDAGLVFATVQRGALEQYVTVTGTLQPVDTVEVGSQIAGQISRLFVDFNDRVAVGTPLAEMDQRTFKAKLDESRASLDIAIADVNAAQAKLDRAHIDADNANANGAVLAARLENGRVQLSMAERGFQRKEALKLSQATSLASVDEAQAELSARQQQFKEAEAAVKANAYAVAGAQADIRRLEAELAQSKASIPLRQASLKVAEIDLDRTTIRSPIDGVVVGRFVNKGQTLAAGLEVRTAFNVAHNLEEMEVHARVDETDIGRVVSGQLAYFSVDAYPKRRFSAVVRQVRKAPQIVQNVVTYTVVLTTDNREGLLLPGMTALVKLSVGRDKDVLKVPQAALRFQPKGLGERDKPRAAAPTVWKRTARGIGAVPVAIGDSTSDQVSISSGNISEHDQVAIGQQSEESRRLFGFKVGL
ncbi:MULTISPECIES: efflux RND transporter periplasmic adaptor subunit [unclassified Beijerinckia]|uniref:efflux RND transporter periplasmic adaptor subunit n=1 Tax=unclassified Beijerinckia TaxID=2638183 RepID=UPI00147A19B2|nr:MULTISPECIES: efflux RND transporter periplasmic adaptor subunit [unclassified Beijerinckia]